MPLLLQLHRFFRSKDHLSTNATGRGRQPLGQQCFFGVRIQRRMQQLIERLWREHGFTALLVTHDVAEAVALAQAFCEASTLAKNGSFERSAMT